jgi:hypothetical protein
MAQGARYFTGLVLMGAAALGTAIGAGSTRDMSTMQDEAVAGLSGLAVSAGLARARAPQPGDWWSGCNEARAAGTAPIYFGEPGYREGMDGDGDGIACEPHR